MGYLIRSELEGTGQYYGSAAFLPLGDRRKLSWSTKLSARHESDVEWAVFIDRKEAFVVTKLA